MDKNELKLEMAKLKYNKKSKAKINKKGKYGKWLVALVILLNTGFAIGVLGVYWHVGSEPKILIGSWFAFTTGELWMLSGIKKNKLGVKKTTEMVTEDNSGINQGGE